MKFELDSIINQYHLSAEIIAPVLFPRLKYPELALRRVLKGEAHLDTQQVEALANYIGVLPADLYQENSWSCSSRSGILIFTKGPYKIQVNGVYISIYKNEELIKQELTCLQGKTIKEFTEYLDNIIKTYENGNN